MKIAILIDNQPNPDPSISHEHGLSIYFEMDGLNWLFDTGASGQFYQNALKMGINCEAVDYLILSHGHSDHTGGLETFFTINKKAKVFISSFCKGKEYFSYRTDSRRNISLDHNLLYKFRNRIQFTEHNLNISEHVGLICEIYHPFSTPKGNSVLTQYDVSGEIQDEFKHEQVVAVKTENGLVVFSGCSHNGLLNILGSCSGWFENEQVSLCIGGTHLIDGNSGHEFETEADLDQLGKLLKDLFPSMKLISGHCTGEKASDKLKSILGENFSTFYSGLVLDV